MDPIVYWFLPAIVIHLALGSVIYRLVRTGADGDRFADGLVDRREGTVVCPDCGVENELGYTYCYDCIGELPGATSRTKTGATPGRRGVR